MKALKRIYLTAVLIATCNFINAQGDWLTGIGNPCLNPGPGCLPAPAGGVGLINNFFGTDPNNDTPVRMGTNGFDRMLMFNGGILNTDGRIAIGNNLPNGFTPTARVHLFHNDPTLLVVTTTTKYSDLSTGTTATDGFEVGYSSSINLAFQNFAQLRNRENTICLLPNFLLV